MKQEVLALVAGAGLPWPAWTSGLLRLLGNASYPLYLLHKPLYHLAYDSLGLRHGWQLLSVAILAAVAVHFLIESPLRKILQCCATHLKGKA